MLHSPLPQVGNADAALAAKREEMESVKERWLPELREIVETINTSFGVNFAEIGRG